MYKKIWWCQNINDTYKRFIIYFRRMSVCIWTFLFYHLFESLDSRIFIAGLPMLHDKIRTISSVANWTRHDFMDNMEKEGITMLYVYDILLNFTDVHTYLNFFEWENKKELTHVKKIPLLKIPNYQLKEIYENSKEEINILDTLDKRERWVANYIVTNGKIKAKDIANHFKINLDTVNNWVKKWIENGFLERYNDKQIRNIDYVLTSEYAQKLDKPNLSRI